MKRALVVALAIVAFPGSALATSGQITGPAITDDGTTVSAQNLSLTLNDAGCGGVLGPTRCGGLAGVLQDSAAGCPAPVAGLPAGVTTLWETDLQTDHYSPWAPSSGPVSVQLPPAHGYRICLYERYFTDTGQKSVTLQASAVVTSLYQPPVDPPVDPPANPPDDAACDTAEAKLAKAKEKLKKLKRRDATAKQIQKARHKVEAAKDAVAAACS
jgi:hypothetical protein